MKVLFEKKYFRDINALSDKELKLKIEQIIIDIENTVEFNPNYAVETA
jgi:hypothetical protein